MKISDPDQSEPRDFTSASNAFGELETGRSAGKVAV